jgi:hypothetical protein
MPRFLVKGSYGFAGTDFEDIFEAEDEDSLNEQVFDFMAEKLSWGFELIEEEEDEQDN